MNRSIRLCALAAASLLAIAAASGQQHRAVRLGHPLTRFAPPLSQPEQLRALFANEKLRADVEEILRQAGWGGQAADLRQAASTAPIAEIELPVGSRLPYMSSRKEGKPVALIDVLWDGDAPVSAYAFDLVSNGRRYRCITPKPCSNFYTVDLGPALPDLALACAAPAQAVVGRRFEVCLVLTNQGFAAETNIHLRLETPPEARLINATEDPALAEDHAAWTVASLEPGAARRVCATFLARQPGLLSYTAAAAPAGGETRQTRCETLATGIPAILLETADLEDPVEVGKEVVYVIKVTNQGSAVGTHLKVTCSLPESQEFVSSEGPAPARVEGRMIVMDTLPELAPKAQAVWRVTIKALKPDDARFKVFISSDQFQKPVQKDEATQLY